MQREPPQLGRIATGAGLILVALVTFLLGVTIWRDVEFTPVRFIGFAALIIAALTAALTVLLSRARTVTFLVMAAIAVPLFVVAAIVHNAVYALTGTEEPFFLFTALFGAPALGLAGLAGLLRSSMGGRAQRRGPNGAAPAA